jgi:hypothetical protein
MTLPPAHLRTLTLIVAHPGALGAAELVELGFVIPPSRRWPTEAGIALVDGMGRP